MSEPFIGEIRMFAGNFEPVGWAFCEGQVMNISQNTALFSILGTTYGGNGQTTFALPDFRGRSPLSSGQGPGLSSHPIGQLGGSETITLTSSQTPAHTHQMNAANGITGVGTQSDPTNEIPAIPGAARGLKAYNSSTASTVAMNNAAVSTVGGSPLPHNNLAPLIAVNFIIALDGIYPPPN